MVHGYHVIFGPYGIWLTNDPPGSWSEFVAARNDLVRIRNIGVTIWRTWISTDEPSWFVEAKGCEIDPIHVIRFGHVV